MSGKVSLGQFEVSRETEKALKVFNDDNQVWVPKSVIHDDSEVYKLGTSGDLVVAEWWAEKNGFL